MDRRKALKNMGLSLGYVVATPTLLSIVQSCKTEKTLEWVPDFFTKEQGETLISLVDLILPATDTPSASELQVHLFIDKFSKEVMPKEQQDVFKTTFNAFTNTALKDSGKESPKELTSANLDMSLSKALKISKGQQKENDKAIMVYNNAIAAQNSSVVLADDVACYAFASKLRGLTIWGYKTSEYVGEKVLAYLPIPGEYIACGDVEELTQNKAWSL
ncbi:gluconate 2-dehydrogenase subunit 3-like protein [Maribacter vaceletii]|uniref:Gluconate 2-dehydrogenase subunit 3-like protein n=1 Tax=Maribacter vaceletii TaxID=1206816 RepID=A0A495EDL3_9FLAO|nr:gluconate 2-dehydrogenase subunit 3 family protein [Maribacter vaceletii]RKR14623.1 gluconate 2-dehydrogenase subunit 3-like protein [Maribacter vaceletii]